MQENITKDINNLTISIFADGADLEEMKIEYRKGYVQGFTTNPTLMKKAGVKDYLDFAREAINNLPNMPLSLEVFADDFRRMEEEADVISQLSEWVYIKIPIMNSKGESSASLIKKLSQKGFKLNVTAIMTLKQVEEIIAVLQPNTNNIISVFAGRIMDTGIDAMPIMKEAAKLCKKKEGTQCLWASCREVYNIFQAQECGVDIITVTNDILKRLPLIGKDLEQFSLETVQMFVEDGKSLGFSII